MAATAKNCHQRLAAGLVLLSVFALIGLAQAATQAKDTDQDNTVRVYKKVAPATVFIASTNINTSHHPALGVAPGNVIGSGLLLDEQGLILTNAHVVEGSSRILVELYDGTQLPADLIGSDQVTDLALLQVALPTGPHVTVSLGDSDHLEVGQKVFAIGHPYGLGYVLSTGIISGLGTALGAAALMQDRVIQTSAAINPGNSGGPLVDTEGRVIGINTAILAGAQNIGFAIPINQAKTIAGELRTHGRVIRPWLGITGKLLTDEAINLFALPLTKGLLVSGVAKGSPAERAGLQAGTLHVTLNGDPWVLGGDILVAVNGLDVRSAEQYARVLKGLKVGQTISLKVKRDGAYRMVSVTLAERPPIQAEPAQPRTPERVEFRPLDWRVETIDAKGAEVSF
jgi:S1-C subfamily serine protease